MAIDNKTQTSPWELKPKWLLLSGVYSLLLGLAGLAGACIWMVWGAQAGQGILAGTWVTLSGVLVVAAACSLSGKRPAVWVLLACWLLAACLGGGLLFFAILWELPAALPSLGWLWIGLTTGLGVLGVLLTIGSTHAVSRGRYGSMVGLSAAVMVLVVVVVNLIAQAYPAQKDFEQLGLFGISSRTRSILKKVQQPITISAVYRDATMQVDTDTERQQRTQAREELSRVMEMLEEIHRTNPQITVRDASSESARKLLITRLQTLQKKTNGPQEELVKTLLKKLPMIKTRLREIAGQGKVMPRDNYLGQWGFGLMIDDALTAQIAALEKAEQEVRQKIAASQLPDWPELLKILIIPVRKTEQLLNQNMEFLIRLGSLPGRVKTNARTLMKQYDICRKSMDGLPKLIGKPGADPPRDPGMALTRYAQALGQLVTQVDDLAMQAGVLAGREQEDVNLLNFCKAWRMYVPAQGGYVPMTRQEIFVHYAKELQQIRQRVALAVTDSRPAVQQQFIKHLRTLTVKLQDAFKDHQERLQKSIDKMTTVDATSQTLIDKAQKGTLFGSSVADLRDMTARVEELGRTDVKAAVSLPDLNGRNIVVLEMGDKIKAVGYDDVWPMQFVPAPGEKQVEETKRIFDGDAALATALLDWVEPRPFARVLLTYLQPSPSMSRMPRAEITPRDLTGVKARLEANNFEVAEWELNTPYPAPTDKSKAASGESNKTVPDVLLVLPTPPNLPFAGQANKGFSDVHIQRLRKAIDDGAQAIFLGMHIRDIKITAHLNIPAYPLNNYLKKDWGIDIKTGYWVFEGIPGQGGDRYKVNIYNLYYQPLTSFSDQPIGKPLRGRRLFWTTMCPIDVAPKPNVDIQPILKISERQKRFWATPDFIRLDQEIHRNNGWVEQGKDAIKPPITLALAAKRNATESRAASRIVVFGISHSFVDRYIQQGVPEVGSDGSLQWLTPPRNNPELLINAVYWLAEQDEYIAAGAGRIEPVAPMSDATQMIIWLGCVVVLPLLVILAGGWVWLVRRRS